MVPKKWSDQMILRVAAAFALVWIAGCNDGRPATAPESVLTPGAIAAQAAVAPRITAIQFARAATAGDVHRFGELVVVRVAFAQTVVVDTTSGAPDVKLLIGSDTARAKYAKQNDDRNLIFHYNVKSADRDPDGMSIPANAMDLGGGAIKSVDASTNADLSHVGLSDVASQKVDGRPWASRITFAGDAPGDSFYRADDTVRVHVTFDQGVVVDIAGGRPQLRLQVGSSTEWASYLRKPTDSTLAFGYAVKTNDVDADGLSVPADSVDLNGGTIKAASDSTTSADLSHDSVAADATRKVQGNRPRAPALQRMLFMGEAPANNTHLWSDTIRLRAEFDRDVIVDIAQGKPSAKLVFTELLGREADTVKALYARHAHRHVDFEYTVQTSDRDDDGAGIAANAVELNGGRILAAADSATAVGIAHGAVAGDTTRKVDGRPRIVRMEFIKHTNSAPKDSVYMYGDKLWVTAYYDQPVVKRKHSNPSVRIEIGADTVPTIFAKIRGEGLALMMYSRVARGNRAPDGPSVPPGVVSLDAGVWLRAASDSTTDARLDHPGVPVDRTRKVNGDLTPIPWVRSVEVISSPADGDTYGLGDTVDVAANIHRGWVKVTGAPELELTVGTATRKVPMAWHVPWALGFQYTVQAGDLDTDGVGVQANALSLPAGVKIQAYADTSIAAALAHPAMPADSEARVDGILPRLVAAGFVSSPAEGATYLYGQQIRTRITFDKSVVVDTVGGKPRMALTIGTRTRPAEVVVPTAPGTTLDFTYTVQTSDRDDDGAGIAANAVELNGGRILAAADSATAVGIAHGAVAGDTTRKVDGRPRIVRMEFIKHTNSAPKDSVYMYGDKLWVTAYYDQPVVKRKHSNPSVRIEIGADTVPTIFAKIRGEGLALMMYSRVARGNRAPDGPSVPPGVVSLDAGVWLRAASDSTTDARLDHPGVPVDRTRKVNGDLTPIPWVRSVEVISSPADGDTYGLGDTVDVAANIHRGWVKVTGAPELELTVGTATRKVPMAWHVPWALGFQYTVQAGDLDTDGVSVQANALSLPTGVKIQAYADTLIAAALAHPAMPADSEAKVDGASGSGDTTTNSVSETDRLPGEGDESKSVRVGGPAGPRPIRPASR